MFVYTAVLRHQDRFLKNIVGIQILTSYFDATGTSIFGFLVTSPLGFKARVGCIIFIVEVNVMYVP